MIIGSAIEYFLIECDCGHNVANLEVIAEDTPYTKEIAYCDKCGKKVWTKDFNKFHTTIHGRNKKTTTVLNPEDTKIYAKMEKL